MEDIRDRIMSRFTAPEERVIASRIMDLVGQAIQSADPQYTDFFDPFQQEVLRSVVQQFPDVRYVMFGGYRSAERKKAVVMPSFYINEQIDFRITALRIELESDPDFELSHRDYLGSMTGLGLRREKIGDILILPDAAEAVIDESIRDFVLANLKKVNRFPVEVTEIDLEQLSARPEKVQQIECTVASLRLDSVAAAGYGTSRTKMAKDIKAKRVKLNWKQETSPDVEVDVGDTISATGRGRVILEEVLGETKKGRTRIRLKKLV